MALANNLATWPYSGLASGFLTGKYRRGEQVESVRSKAVAKYLDERGYRVVDALSPLAGSYRVPVAAVALRWLAQQPGVLAPIASARTPEQLADLLRLGSFTLTDGELAELRAAAAAERPPHRAELSRCDDGRVRTDRLTIPSDLLPADGRFGSGPSKLPLADLRAFAEQAGPVLGTSHRQPPVKALIGRIRAGLATLFQLPDGYQVVLGNGGSTAFWDAAAFGLIRRRSQHVQIGEFSAKFAAVTRAAPFLDEPSIRRAEPGSGHRPRSSRTGWTPTPGRRTRRPPA